MCKVQEVQISPFAMRFLSFCRSSALSPLRVAQFRFFHFPLVGKKLLYSASYGRYASPRFDTGSAKSMETNRSCRFVADHPFGASAKGKLFPWRAHAKESVSWLLAPTTSIGAPIDLLNTIHGFYDCIVYRLMAPPRTSQLIVELTIC